MLFNSLAFLVFFPLVVVTFFVTPGRWRWLLLLVASYVFYGWWKPAYLGLIFFSTVVDYVAGLGLGKAATPLSRRFWLAVSLSTNLGLLFFFKYLGFATQSLEAVLAYLGQPQSLPRLDVLLPVGISFYTFQTLSYTIDVYRGQRAPERHFGIFALYVSFFPQLVAGPIERSTHLLPQFRVTHAFSYTRLARGLQLAGWGFFKKLVIADRLAEVVDYVYGQPEAFTALSLAVGTYAFSFQIYCDFSGYSDIAIGTAEVLGFDLMRNFRNPYGATSIADFWRRWHISLSTWFRDYVYIPLGGNRVALGYALLNVSIVFVVSGVWHGANWTFVVWGALFAVAFVLERLGSLFLANRWRPSLPAWLSRSIRVLVVYHVVCLAWIFFRASSVGDAMTILRALALGTSNKNRWQRGAESVFGLDAGQLAVAAAAVLLLVVVDFLVEKRDLRDWLAAMSPTRRWAAMLGVVLAILHFGMFESPQSFIYFQF